LENNFDRPTVYKTDVLYGGGSKHADPDFIPKTKRVPITLTAQWRHKAWDEAKEQREKGVDAAEKEFVAMVAVSFGGPMQISREAPEKVPEDYELTEESEEVPEDEEMTEDDEKVQGEHDMTGAPMEALPLFSNIHSPSSTCGSFTTPASPPQRQPAAQTWSLENEMKDGGPHNLGTHTCENPAQPHSLEQEMKDADPHNLHTHPRETPVQPSSPEQETSDAGHHGFGTHQSKIPAKKESTVPVVPPASSGTTRASTRIPSRAPYRNTSR
jgi:hypothetical protein